MRMARNQLKAGVILSYISQFIQIVVALVYTPIMLRLLGQSEYGLYQLVYSVVSYLHLLSMGFSSSYIRFYSRFKAEKNDKGVKILNGMFVIIFSFISLTCFILGIILVVNAEIVFGNGLTPYELSKARVLMALMVVNLVLTFETSTFECNVIAEEKFIFQKLVIIIQHILSPVITLPLLLLGKGAIGMVSVTTALTCIKLIVCLTYAYKQNRMRFAFREFDWLLLKEMWVFTFFIFINNIIDQINWSVDRFLLGRIVGTSAVAIYGVAGQLNTMYIQFSTSISNVFVPRINKMVSAGRSDSELSSLFIKVGRIQFYVLALIISGFVLFGKSFIRLWAGADYTDSYIVALLLLIPVTIPLIQNLGIEIQRAKNMHKARSLVYLGIALANIGISIPLIIKYGPAGAACGTAITLIAGNVLFMNWYYDKRIGLDIKGFWKNILMIIPSFFPPIAAAILLNVLLANDGWLWLIAKIVVYTVIYILSAYFIAMNADERSMMKGVIVKFKGKITGEI